MTRQGTVTTWWLTGLPGAGKTTLAQRSRMAGYSCTACTRCACRSANVITTKNHQN